MLQHSNLENYTLMGDSHGRERDMSSLRIDYFIPPFFIKNL